MFHVEQKTKIMEKTVTTTSEQILLLEKTAITHEKYKNAYFWNPSNYSDERRRNEKRFPGESYTIETELGELEVEQTYRESCRNCYYKFSVHLNGEKKDIRIIKKLLNLLIKNNKL